jgi:hypothetical protein
MGDEMHRRDPSCAGLLKDFHTAWAKTGHQQHAGFRSIFRLTRSEYGSTRPLQRYCSNESILVGRSRRQGKSLMNLLLLQAFMGAIAIVATVILRL